MGSVCSKTGRLEKKLFIVKMKEVEAEPGKPTQAVGIVSAAKIFNMLVYDHNCKLLKYWVA
jgi:hypothetical protein